MRGLDLLRLERRAEALLVPWEGSRGPGVTVGVVLGGALALHRSAGLASVELGVPIGPRTRFRIASVSKQFTTAAVLVLAREGKLDLEDEARTYLPELPQYEQGRVTVAHLMHNTSGIRDMLEIMRQGGADLGVPIGRQALLDGIFRQRTPNFVPGTRFLYSNSNFLLLGLIAERLSGQPLDKFLEQRFFAPLGMTATSLASDMQRVVPHLATGYLPAGDGGWRRAPHAFPLGGEGGLVSSVEDLALWDRALATGRGIGDWLAPALSRQAPFPNGSVNRYARGQVVRPYRGTDTISHGGLWPGYRTEFLRVPEHDATIIVISNDGSADPNLLAHQTLDALIEDRPGVHALPALPGRDKLEALAGRYMDRDTGTTVDLGTKEDGTPTITLNGLTVTAEPTEDGRLASPRSNSVFALRAEEDGILVEQDAGTTSVWRRIAPGASLPAGLAGTYRSAEMASTWELRTDGHAGPHAMASGPVATSGQPWPLEPVAGDHFRIRVPGILYETWMDVQALRDTAGAVTGLLASGARAKAVRYDRQG